MSVFKLWADSSNKASYVVRLKLEPSGKPGSSKVPFEVADRDEYKAMIKGKGIFKRAEDLEPEEVPLKGLKAIQRTVNDERVAQHFEGGVYAPGARAPGSGGLIDRPVFVLKNGKTYVHDGHHRCTAAILRGDKTISARVVRLDSE